MATSWDALWVCSPRDANTSLPNPRKELVSLHSKDALCHHFYTAPGDTSSHTLFTNVKIFLWAHTCVWRARGRQRKWTTQTQTDRQTDKQTSRQTGLGYRLQIPKVLGSVFNDEFCLLICAWTAEIWRLLYMGHGKKLCTGVAVLLWILFDRSSPYFPQRRTTCIIGKKTTSDWHWVFLHITPTPSHLTQFPISLSPRVPRNSQPRPLHVTQRVGDHHMYKCAKMATSGIGCGCIVRIEMTGLHIVTAASCRIMITE